MKLAVSSLAWDPLQDDAMRAALVRRGVGGIELAPLKYWPEFPDVAPRALSTYREEWSNARIAIVALQGILFGKPELQLFGSVEQQAALERHLAVTARCSAQLGASVIVLGAPKNRARGALSEEDAIARAAPLLRRVAIASEEHGVTLCIEPNPPRYGGDFVCTTTEALRLVGAVDHPGFRLHLDAGALAINAESDDEILVAARNARHFHISEIDLQPIGSGTVDHRHVGDVLCEAAYDHWVSIEMRPIPADALAATIAKAIDVSIASYGLANTPSS